MKYRTMLFNSEMFRAILDGRKTQTRRICKGTNADFDKNDKSYVYTQDAYGDYHTAITYAPHGQPGDRLLVHHRALSITLEITGVRVERLQDISAIDCVHEGIETNLSPLATDDDLRLHFKAIWDSINAESGYPWDLNPWVWVYEFRRLAEDVEA